MQQILIVTEKEKLISKLATLCRSRRERTKCSLTYSFFTLIFLLLGPTAPGVTGEECVHRLPQTQTRHLPNLKKNGNHERLKVNPNRIWITAMLQNLINKFLVMTSSRCYSWSFLSNKSNVTMLKNTIFIQIWNALTHS